MTPKTFESPRVPRDQHTHLQCKDNIKNSVMSSMRAMLNRVGACATGVRQLATKVTPMTPQVPNIGQSAYTVVGHGKVVRGKREAARGGAWRGALCTTPLAHSGVVRERRKGGGLYGPNNRLRPSWTAFAGQP